MHPNILLIVLDAARADAFEPYGARVGSSPMVADLARRGAALPLVFAPGSWTIPSHAALFTGQLPRAVGIRGSPGAGKGDIRRRHRAAVEAQRSRFLPEVLRQAGYATAALSANLWLAPDSGFGTGFDTFVSVDTARQTQLRRDDLRSRVRWDLEGILARVDDGAAEAERVIASWIAETPGRPFFWFVNLIECHSPYLPPRPYNDLGPLGRLRAAEEARRYLTLDAVWKACAGGFEVPDSALERMRRLYRGAIRALDDWLERVLTRMDGEGLLADTLVIVTSDHGENLGEAGLMGHSFSLDDRLIRVPCVVSGPQALPPQLPHQACSLATLPRLIAEATGVDDHPWAEGLPPAGVAVAQFDPPAGPDDPRVTEALDRWGLDNEAAERLTTPLTCATDGHHKLLLRGEREELYDLRADPLETSPLDPARDRAPIAVHVLRKALSHPAAQAGAEPSTPETAEAGPGAKELEERMKLLGYM